MPATRDTDIDSGIPTSRDNKPVITKNSGFTLIELMIVVSIIGILAAIAMPFYQRYTVRSQVTEGLTLSGGAQSAVSEYYFNYGTWPSDNDEAGLSDMTTITGLYTTQVEVVDNVIEIQYGGNAHGAISGQLITLTATENFGSVSWTCASGGTIANKHLPDACR